LVDEYSYKEVGAPITWLNYYAWKRGPVPSDIYFDSEKSLQAKTKVLIQG